MAPLILTLLALAAPQVAVDPALPEYKPQSEVKGTIKCISNDVMFNYAVLIREAFRKHHPGTDIQIERETPGAVALAKEQDSVAMMARAFSEIELERIEKATGRKPIRVTAMYDMVAVFVHKDNPMESITLAQLDAMYSITRKRAHREDIKTWGQLGLKGEWADRAIRPQGRVTASSSYGFFKKVVLSHGEFKDPVKEHPGSLSLVEAIADDVSAIGYAGVGYANPKIKALAVALDTDSKPIRPLPELVYGGTYPLSRTLDLAVNHDSEKGLDSGRQEFFRFVFSKQGQECVARDGYFPVSAVIGKEQLKKLGIDK